MFSCCEAQTHVSIRQQAIIDNAHCLSLLALECRHDNQLLSRNRIPFRIQFALSRRRPELPSRMVNSTCYLKFQKSAALLFYQLPSELFSSPEWDYTLLAQTPLIFHLLPDDLA